VLSSRADAEDDALFCIAELGTTTRTNSYDDSSLSGTQHLLSLSYGIDKTRRDETKQRVDLIARPRDEKDVTSRKQSHQAEVKSQGNARQSIHVARSREVKRRVKASLFSITDWQICTRSGRSNCKERNVTL
jgi:hypothetical protein